MPCGDKKDQWYTVTSRPSRRPDTVVLDAGQMDDLVQDVNEYLSPTAEEW